MSLLTVIVAIVFLSAGCYYLGRLDAELAASDLRNAAGD